MALVKCPECGKMVSTRSSACPECGCPSEFFSRKNEEEAISKPVSDSEISPSEYKIFNFKQNYIKYPINSEKYARLFGDYLKLGFAKCYQLYDVYKRLGNLDSIKERFGEIAQKMIDDQIDIILKELYIKGRSMTIGQFKHKYSETYLLDYPSYINLLFEKYDSFLGIKQQINSDQEVLSSNRARWIGGGFGIKGAIKGAVKAGILNMGSSVLSGLGNAVVTSVSGNVMDSKKQALYENEEVIQEVCEGIVICMNNLFFAYTNELCFIGEIGNKIELDYETAYTKYETAMRYEKDKEKFFATIIECIGLYPADRTFYEAIEMELEECSAWSDFKEFWNIDFLYKEREVAFFKTEAKMDSKLGTLKLIRNLLIFEGENPEDSIKIPIGSIKKVEKNTGYFSLGLKGKFLLLVFKTEADDIWVNTLNNAINGKYEKIYLKNNKTVDTIAMKEENLKKKVSEAEEYIIANFTCKNWTEAVSYYEKYVGVSWGEAREVVKKIFNELAFKESKYPGFEDLDKGLFKGDNIVLLSGDDDIGFLVLTLNNLIEIDVKKNKETVYDVYKISHMEGYFFDNGLMFKYPGKLLKVSLALRGLHASAVINKIENIQKGNF